MQQILQHLFNKKSLHEVEPEALEAVTREYPYFAAAQFFYTQGLQVKKEPRYPGQYQKTLLYFSNPLWLKYQLDQAQASTQDGPGGTSGAPVLDIADSTDVVPGSSRDMIEDVVLHQEKDYLDGGDGEIQSRGFDSINRDLTQTSSDISGLIHPVQPEIRQSENQAIPVVSEPGPEVQTSPHLQKVEADPTDDHDLPPGDLPLQAYHTVDYFASQGIKLSQEALSNDKLGKQMKSFTEWLKTMRRLPEPVAEEVLEKIDDSNIAKYAAHSLEEKEVVTEAMAEVLFKQGKTARAIEVYQKLSLLNLHKSAYFAAKIEGLKQH